MPDRKVSILHLSSDSKFVNAANYIFEKAFPGCNHFIIPHSKFRRKLSTVKIDKNVEIAPYGKSFLQSVIEKSQKYDCVILHGITEFNSSVFLLSENKNKFVGLLWGAELYTEENFPKLLGKKTASLNIRQPELALKERIKGFGRQILYGKSIILPNATKLAAASLSYFSSEHIEEFDFFMKRKLISEKCQHIPFTYSPLEYILKGYQSSYAKGNDILLGNSAAITNNHLEAFQILKGLGTGNRSIIVPLSYGNRFYADTIISNGFDLFNESFKPLRSFMPLYDYIKVIQSCGIAIMNHYRQQAMGNILAMLWLGSKVYLNKSNTYFHYLKRIGIIVYSIEDDLVKENKDALNNLNKNEMDHNRKILQEVNGEEHVIEVLRERILKFF